jgi:UDP-N-acetylmuramoyl-tripeptide--D-alanyl-D-alanine ligase
MLTLADITQALTGVRPNRALPVITQACIDSRQVIPGALFVALPGERVDGHDYVAEAFRRGATLAFVERELPIGYVHIDLRSGPGEVENLLGTTATEGPVCFIVPSSLKALQTVAAFWRSRLAVKVIGITGSVGKSTTKELVADVLNQRYRTLRNAGNLNNEIGLPMTLLDLGEGHERAVLEMGFYVPGEIAFLCELAKPVIGVVTNVGTVHAERAGNQETIAQGKAELVQALPPAPDGVAILNYDDPLVRVMAEKTSARVFYYGLDPAADLWADQVEGLGLEGIRFCLHYQGETMYLKAPLIGRHSVHTALRAAAVGLMDNLTWEEIIAGLGSSTTQLRLMAVRTKQGALILDDTYNASPESTLAALNLLDELQGRKIAVLGDMLELGRYEQQGHEMVGIRAAEVADRLITVGERGRLIAQAAQNAGLSALAVTSLENTAQVVEILVTDLKAGDIVLVKGSRSMRMDRVVADLEYIA